MNIRPYAPTSNLSYSAINRPGLNEEISLFSTPKQRELFESLAEIYSIVVALDKLEKAYLKDSVSQNEYTPTCLRLIAQYNTILNNEDVSSEFKDLETFKSKYNMNFAHATSRLKIGVPATVEQAVEHSHTVNTSVPGSLVNNVSSKAVAEATGNFITMMDGLKLKFKAKDQLHPLLSELMTSLNKVTNNNFEGRGKLVQWLITLNGMKATEELSEEQARQLLFDLDDCYKSFYTSLE